MNRYEDPFLKYRAEQERKHLSLTSGSADPIDSLMIVELNITELCNRVCEFCPRVDPDRYPNRNLKMDLAVTAKVAEDLARGGYRGRISFSGFGECLLNKEFEEHVRILRRRLPDNTIETNTNGDRLSVERIRSLFDAGISAIYVNLYDGPEQKGVFERRFAAAGIDESRWRLRPHWMGADVSWGLTLNNRSGNVDVSGLYDEKPALPLKNRCHYPFYKMFIDWDGSVLFCSNDWGRNIPIANVMEQEIRDIWLSPKMREIRERLSGADRSFTPCSGCDVLGTMVGGRSHDLLMDYYASVDAEQATQRRA